MRIAKIAVFLSLLFVCSLSTVYLSSDQFDGDKFELGWSLFIIIFTVLLLCGLIICGYVSFDNAEDENERKPGRVSTEADGIIV